MGNERVMNFGLRALLRDYRPKDLLTDLRAYEPLGLQVSERKAHGSSLPTYVLRTSTFDRLFPLSFVLRHPSYPFVPWRVQCLL